MTLTSRSPHSSMSSRTAFTAYVPVDPFEGTTTIRFILERLSTTANTTNFCPSSSPGKQ